ncbi:MAG: carbohydrate ABC transporter permease [Treponema sp.]|nr:carbohydrate ABC transporter permease [Treponema sp.]
MKNSTYIIIGKFNTVIRYIVIVLSVVIIVFPIYWLILTSLRPIEESLSYPPNFFLNFETVTLKYYTTVLSGKIGSSTNVYGLPTFFINSVIVSGATTILSVSFSLLAAYSLVRLSFKGRKFISHLILFCYLIPGISLLIPMFTLAVNLKLNNTLYGIMLFQTAGSLPLGIWFAKAFLKGLPLEVEESAFLDGCNRMQIIIKIVTPLAVPALVVVGFNTFLGSWNDFILPSILIDVERWKPLMVGLYLYFNQNIGLVWGEMMAAAFIALAPVFFIFFYFQKYIVGGLSTGAIKG